MKRLLLHYLIFLLRFAVYALFLNCALDHLFVSKVELNKLKKYCILCHRFCFFY